MGKRGLHWYNSPKRMFVARLRDLSSIGCTLFMSQMCSCVVCQMAGETASALVCVVDAHWPSLEGGASNEPSTEGVHTANRCAN